MGEDELDRQPLLRGRPEQRRVEHLAEEPGVVRPELAELQHLRRRQARPEVLEHAAARSAAVAVPPKSIAPAGEHLRALRPSRSRSSARSVPGRRGRGSPRGRSSPAAWTASSGRSRSRSRRAPGRTSRRRRVPCPAQNHGAVEAARTTNGCWIRPSSLRAVLDAEQRRLRPADGRARASSAGARGPPAAPPRRSCSPRGTRGCRRGRGSSGSGRTRAASRTPCGRGRRRSRRGRISSSAVRIDSRSDSVRMSGCLPVACSQRRKPTSYLRHCGGTPRRMYARPSAAVLWAPFAYQVSPQPLPSASRKL